MTDETRSAVRDLRRWVGNEEGDIPSAVRIVVAALEDADSQLSTLTAPSDECELRLRFATQNEAARMRRLIKALM